MLIFILRKHLNLKRFGYSVGQISIVGNTLYVGTDGGISTSHDGGKTFTNKTTQDGLSDNDVNGVYAIGNVVYAATGYGLSMTHDNTQFH